MYRALNSRDILQFLVMLCRISSNMYLFWTSLIVFLGYIFKTETVGSNSKSLYNILIHMIKALYFSTHQPWKDMSVCLHAWIARNTVIKKQKNKNLVNLISWKLHLVLIFFCVRMVLSEVGTFFPHVLCFLYIF